MRREMLNKWAATQDDRRTIIEFWEWLNGDEWPDDVDLDIERALDKFHGIDRAQLDRERRELLDTHNVPVSGCEAVRSTGLVGKED